MRKVSTRNSSCADDQRVPRGASLARGRSLLGRPRRMPVAGSVTRRQPNSFSCWRAAASRAVRCSCVSSPVTLALLRRWKFLTATMNGSSPSAVAGKSPLHARAASIRSRSSAGIVACAAAGGWRIITISVDDRSFFGAASRASAFAIAFAGSGCGSGTGGFARVAAADGGAVRGRAAGLVGCPAWALVCGCAGSGPAGPLRSCTCAGTALKSSAITGPISLQRIAVDAPPAPSRAETLAGRAGRANRAAPPCAHAGTQDWRSVMRDALRSRRRAHPTSCRRMIFRKSGSHVSGSCARLARHARRSGTRTLCAPYRPARDRRPGPGEAQGGARAGRRRRRPRFAAAALSRRRRRRHARHRRRGQGRALQSAATGDLRNRGYRPREGGPGRGRGAAPQPARRGRSASAPARSGKRARSDRALRHRRRRFGQFRDTLSRFGRLLFRPQTAGDGGARNLRRLAHDHPRARARQGRRAQPHLSLPVPRAAAARHGAGLRGGRHSRCLARRTRRAEGARGDPRDRRLRRRTRAPPVDDRRALAALRDAELRLGSGQSVKRQGADDHRAVLGPLRRQRARARGAAERRLPTASARRRNRPSLLAERNAGLRPALVDDCNFDRRSVPSGVGCDRIESAGSLQVHGRKPQGGRRGEPESAHPILDRCARNDGVTCAENRTEGKKAGRAFRHMATGTKIRWLVSALLLAMVVALVLRNSGGSELLRVLGDLPALTVALVLAALVLNGLAASLRFKVIAADIGHALDFGKAMAAVSAGGLGGALLFQLAGQLMARGAVMARNGIGFPSVVVMTLYERVVAALAAGLLALAGAYFIFGRVALDRASGGADFIKIAVGLFAAIGAGALFGYGRTAARAVAPFLTPGFALRFLRSLALSVLVQIPMMAAYVLAAHALAPATPVVDIAAASSIVMFAASVPVSLAGWGMRELSAAVALSAMALIATMSLRAWTRPGDAKTAPSAGPKLDYARMLAAALPLAAATLVLFQIYVPIRSILLNVNLADPLAVLGGALFLLEVVRSGRRPRWRFPWLNIAVAAATAVLTVSLLIGAARFGLTQWALVNRYVGWFVLLCFAASGALMVRDGGQGALQMLLRTFAGATAAVAAIELALLLVRRAGFPILPVNGTALEGFAQNHNVFAFQALMAVAAVVAAVRGGVARIALLALLFAGLWFAASRSGWISLLFVLGAGLYLRAVSARELAGAALGAAFLVALVVLVGTAANTAGPLFPDPIPTESNTAERLQSLAGGWHLFLQHPVFGAGLGAYRNLGVLASSGLPLVIHSTPVWLLAETGIVGLAVFAVPSLIILFTEARRAHPDAAAVAIVLCLVGFGVMGGPADMVYQRTFWLLIGAALACLPAASCGDVAHSIDGSTRSGGR